MVINDNVEVAAALPEHVGLHLGQDDTKLAQARAQLGASRLIGMSVHTPEEAAATLETDADYAGVGPCWATQSKAGVTEDDALMLSGSRAVVEKLKSGSKRLPCVLIGSLNMHTAARTLAGATSAGNGPDGVAVISAIVARRDPDRAARDLRCIVDAYKQRAIAQPQAVGSLPTTAQDYVKSARGLLQRHLVRYDPESRTDVEGDVDAAPPLVQTITSHVSAYFSANVALAFSASPIMSQEAAEAEALSQATKALVLNIGSLSHEARHGMAVAGPAANRLGTPVVLDPVGGGATPFRAHTCQALLNETCITLIKGNAAEIGSLAGSDEVRSRGVDSQGTVKDAPGLVHRVARQEGAFVLMTGEHDYLTDGEVVLECSCGSALLGRITATGCSLGVVIGAGLATARRVFNVEMGDAVQQRITPPRFHKPLLLGALAGLLTYTIAAERAAQLPNVRGPGTFMAALLDELAAFDVGCLSSYTDRVRVL